MFFWQKNNKEEQARKHREQATLDALSRGEVPPSARERIERQQAMGSKFFTSDLSTREYLLCQQAGFQTIGQVMGTSFFNITYVGSYGASRMRTTGELENMTWSNTEARRLAISRMQHEAALLGASGVIGVRIQVRRFDWGIGQTEFTAIGTAVKIPGYPHTEEPFTSDLSAQDFWKLYQAGYRPLKLAFGICHYYIVTDPSTANLIAPRLVNSAPNQEVQVHTQGVYRARELAMNRLSSEVKAAGGDGIVQVMADLDVQHLPSATTTVVHDLLVNCHLAGTVISSHDEKIENIPEPSIFCDLTSLGRTSVTFHGGMESYLDDDDDDD